MNTEKPPCKLSGTDGNVFSIIAAVSKALKRAGSGERADQWRAAAMSCSSYDAVLQLCFDYVDVE